MAVRHHVTERGQAQHTAQLRKLDEATGGTRVMHALLSAQRDPALGDAHVVLGVDRGEEIPGIRETRRRPSTRSQAFGACRVEVDLVVGGVVVILHDCPA